MTEAERQRPREIDTEAERQRLTKRDRDRYCVEALNKGIGKGRVVG